MEHFPKHATIVYAVLNWGLGHATRSIPIIEKLLKRNNKIILVSDGMAFEYLQMQFPHLPIEKITPYNITYPFSSIFINLLVQFYKPIWSIYKEHEEVKIIVKKYKADYIISDNRYGCFAKATTNIIVTHQILPYHKNLFIRYIFGFINYRLLKSFNEIWVPDDEHQKLSGVLSNYNFKNPIVRFIGIQSRMIPCEIREKKYITILLSGPEPQRTYLENSLLYIVKANPQKLFYLIRGTISSNKIIPQQNLFSVDLASTSDLNQILCNSSIVICRSGYSTLMDLKALNLDAILIPTPGQTEQEYLAEVNSNRWKWITKSEMYKIEEFILNW
jgi:hypothetical protein